MIHQPKSIEEIQNFDGKYPKQLWYLFFSEMWERFCFYGMRGMLTFFMVDQLLMKEDVANLQYGATQAFVYAFTFIGGLFADKILGYRKSLFWGGIMMIIGSTILALDPHNFFFIGISFTVIGTGFFKPNISTMVGTLYKANDTRRDAGFSLFYSGINIGALLGGYACVFIGKNYSWNLAFGLAGIVMIISLVTFLFTQKSLANIGLSPLLHLENSKRKLYEYLTYGGTILAIPLIMIMVSNPQYTDYFMYTIGPLTLIYLFYEMRNYSIVENKKIIAALVFIVFSVIFWAFFEQSGGSLSLFAANNLDDKIFGITFDPNGINNASNSLFVIIFAPILGLIWIWLSKRKAEPNTVVKFGLGFLFLAFAFYVFYATKFFANSDGMTSLEIFTIAYFIITLGELCLSPIGLSIMTKLSPIKLQGVMMGMWFLASAYGQYVAGILGAGMAKANENATKSEKLIAYTDGYHQLAIYALIAGIVLILISPIVKKLMNEIK
ncbi:MAG: peptide MFS transporter [Flavobacterium sp.]|jgi:POT family proton-dependent oligopeptide transporter